MTSRSLRVATIGGTDVHVAPSWVLIAAAIVWSYQRAFTGDGRSLALTITMAVAAALLFTGSVLLHEVAHALEGTHRGAEVGGITLFLLGGATSLRGGDDRAVDEFAIAAVGPWSNVVLAAGFGLTALYAGSWGLDAVADVAGLLGWLNLGLAAFNLVPGAPLDGGRVLRAAVWSVTGDRNRATTVAAVVGMALAAGLIGWSVWLIGMQPGGITSGVWVGLIGAYVLRAARMELTRGRLASWLARHSAAELAPAAPRIPAHTTTTDLDTLFAGPDAPRAVLVDDGGRPVGVLLRPDDGDTTGPPGDTTAPPGDTTAPPGDTIAPPGDTTAPVTAGDAATALGDLPVVRADEPGDRLSGLLDREQPLVLLEDDEGTWLSTIHLIDGRIRSLRDGAPS